MGSLTALTPRCHREGVGLQGSPRTLLPEWGKHSVRLGTAGACLGTLSREDAGLWFPRLLNTQALLKVMEERSAIWALGGRGGGEGGGGGRSGWSLG